MKLYEIFVANNLDYEDYDHHTKLIVANDKEEAEIRAELYMNEMYSASYEKPSYSVEEINKVDGFKINVSR